MRRSLYENRMRKIIEKSIIHQSYEIGENEFLDYTSEEIDKMLMMDKNKVVNGTANNFYEENMAYFEEMESMEELLEDSYDKIVMHESDSKHPVVMGPKIPDAVDWRKPVVESDSWRSSHQNMTNTFARDMLALTPIVHQGSCGSCWAFAAVGVLEAAARMKTGEKVKFS